MKRLLWVRFLLITCIAGGLLAGSVITYAQEDDSLTPIQATVILEQVCAGDGEYIEYSGYRVQGDLDFTLLPDFGCEDRVIPVQFKIVDSVFEGDLVTGDQDIETRFQDALNLSDATFEGSVQMVNTTFEGIVNLNDAIFTQGALFGLSTFEDQAAFPRVLFLKGASFSRITFQGVSFLQAEFHDAPLFQGIDFGGTAVFTESKFIDGTKAIFNQTTFARTVFTQAEFSIDVGFWNSDFTDTVNFRDAHFGGSVDFKGSGIGEIDLTGITMNRGQLNLFDMNYESLVAQDFDSDWVMTSSGSFTPWDAREIFSRLETDFREQEREDLANEAFYHRQNIECSEAEDWSSTFYACLVVKPIGYFVRPGRVIWLSIGIILFFGVLYSLLLARKGSSKTVQLQIPVENSATGEPLERKLVIEAKEILQVVQDSAGDSPRSTKWRRHILQGFGLSISDFISPRSIKAQTELEGWWASLVVSILIRIEWIIGLFLLIALAASFTKTYPPLRDLIQQLPTGL